MKKSISLFVALVLTFALAACGGKAQSEQTPSGGGAAIVPPTPSTQPAASIPEPVVINQALLTGLEKGPEYPEGKRVTAVMVNNIAQSRPTRGLSQCQILIEIKVEGGITRFMPIYEDYTKIPQIGSVRSARDQFFQLLLPFKGFYVHDGQSVPMVQFFKDWEYEEFDLAAAKYGVSGSGPSDGAMNWRQSRPGITSTEFTEYTDGAHIAQTIENNGLDDFRNYGSPMFNFVPYTEPPRVPTDGPMEELAVIHSASYITHFKYNQSSAMYEMSQWNSYYGQVQQTIDENNDQQVQFNNLVVIFAPMTLYNNSPLVKVDYIGGAGYYYSQGHYELIFWQKGGPNEALQLYKGDKSGQPVMINTGTTYLAVVDDKELPAYDTVMKTGGANAAVQGGDVNKGEVETED